MKYLISNKKGKGLDHQIPIPTRGATILESCLEANVEINHSCGGQGTCGTCRILVDLKTLKELSRNEIEQEMAADRQFSENERLSCQLVAEEGIKFEIPPSKLGK